MSNKIKPKSFDRYLHYADKAVKCEQAEQYAEAAEYWEIAKLSATGKNLDWCEYRANLCQRLVGLTRGE